mgnify:CR=1 FL=1
MAPSTAVGDVALERCDRELLLVHDRAHDVADRGGKVVADDPSVEVVIVSVCDQPLLSSGHIESLLARHKETGKKVIASQYSGAPGVPALFHKTFFERLMLLPDDQGAKKIILENMGEASLIPFPGGEIDLDTMEDYRSYLDTAGTA